MGRAITKENLGTGLWPEIGRHCLRLPTALLLGTPSQVLGGSWSTRSQTRKALATGDGWKGVTDAPGSLVIQSPVWNGPS